MDYEGLRSYAAAKTGAEQPALDEFLSVATRDAAATVVAASGKSFELTVVPPEWPGADQAWSEGPASVSVGLVLLRKLDDAALGFTNVLLENYYVQQLGFGPAVPLPLLIGAREFPAAALELYAANMLPKAADPLGGVRSDFESVTASLMFGPSDSVSEMRKNHGRMPKRFGLRPRRRDGDDLAPLRSEPLPHALFMYGRLITDALALIVAHEASHLILGHLDAEPSAPQRSREQEVEADRNAITLLAGAPDFNLRSATLLFAFLQAEDRTEHLAQLTHPFAADRLAVLAASTSAARDERLVADVNAGFQLLRKPIPVQTPALADGSAPPAAEAWATSDLSYGATLTVDLRLPPSGTFETVVPPWELVAQLHLRDRINPAVVHRTGTATARFDAAGFSDTIGAAEHTETFSFAFAAPPSWWIDLDNAVLEIASADVRVVSASNPSAPVSATTYDIETPAADVEASFGALAQRAPRVAILAAHRAMDAEPDARAIAFVEQARSGLGDRDLRALAWLARKLIDGGDLARAAALLRDAIATEPYVPAELRLLLAAADWRLFRAILPTPPPGKPLDAEPTRLYDEAYDLAVRALNLFVDDTPKQQAALLVRAITDGDAPTPSVARMLEGIGAHTAGIAAMRNDPAAAARSFANAVAAFERALAADVYRPVIALEFAGDAATARALVSDRDFAAAGDYFRRVLAADPSFLPALTELAKIGLEREDYPAVREALARADALSPSHPFLDYVRREYDRRIAAFVATQRAVASDSLDAGDPARGMAAAEQLAQLDPALPEVLNLRAIAGYYGGDLTAARDAMLAYIAAEGEALHSLTMLGQIQLELGAVRDAWETLSMALGNAAHQVKAEDITGPTTPVIPYSDRRGRSFAIAARAVALYALGDHTAAATDAAEAERGFPNGAIALLDCAEVQRLAGDGDAARRLAQAALDATELPLPARVVQRARAFLAGGSGSLLAASDGAVPRP